MPRSSMRIDHQVPITSLQMFSSPYLEIPIDQDDPRGREPLISLASVGVAFESYYAKTDGQNPPFGVAIEGSRQDIWLRKSVVEKLARVPGVRDMRSSFVIGTVKEGALLPLPASAGL